ncbi:MAG: hypothetical protein WCR74_05875 [Betaproteobacteria bacterium]
MKLVPFPPGTKFFDVDDVPVAKLPDGKCVFPDGSEFPNPAKVFAYAGSISKDCFDAMAAAFAASE